MRCSYQIGAILLLLVTATAALAVDGVIEINQVAAKVGGVTPGDAPLFPVTLSRPGSYRLTGNLDVTDTTAIAAGAEPKNVTAIVVTASNVTVDLNGFAIIGPVTCSGEPTACDPNDGSGDGVKTDGRPVRGVTVRNGSVRGMGDDGVEVEEEGAHQVENVRAISNRDVGIDVDGGIVRECVAQENGGDGINVSEGGIVRGCVAQENGADGIDAGGGVVVVGNLASDNGELGLCGSIAIGYGNNVLRGNDGGEVDGNSNQIGTNVCGDDTICP